MHCIVNIGCGGAIGLHQLSDKSLNTPLHCLQYIDNIRAARQFQLLDHSIQLTLRTGCVTGALVYSRFPFSAFVEYVAVRYNGGNEVLAVSTKH